MKTVKGYHGECNMGSPGGWEYQRMAQMLGKMAWDLIQRNLATGPIGRCNSHWGKGESLSPELTLAWKPGSDGVCWFIQSWGEFSE